MLKVAFPIEADAVRTVWEALRLPAPALARESYTAEQLEAELTGPGTGVRAVAVHKHRVRYVIDGCTSELTDVIADGRTTRTIAVETEDPALVTAAVRTLGLADYRNTAYPPGLAALLDGVAPRYAVIDAGTNSIKFHVAERDGGGFRTLVDRAELTRLGEGLEAGGEVIGGRARRARATRSPAMVDEADALHAVAIAAVGTAGLRIATNREDCRPGGRRGDRRADRGHLGRGGGAARLPRGPRRARAAGRVAGGVRHGRRQHAAHVRHRRPRSRSGSASTSVPCGSRSGSASTAPVSTEVLAEALAAIRADLSRLDGRDPVDRLVGMGGAVTNIAAVAHGMTTYDPDVIQGSVLERVRARPPARAVPDAARRRAALDPRAPAQARGRDPRRGMRRGLGHGRARRRPVDGQRPRPPARRPGHAVRRHPDRNGGIDMSPTKAKAAAASPRRPATHGGSHRPPVRRAGRARCSSSSAARTASSSR